MDGPSSEMETRLPLLDELLGHQFMFHQQAGDNLISLYSVLLSGISIATPVIALTLAAIYLPLCSDRSSLSLRFSIVIGVGAAARYALMWTYMIDAEISYLPMELWTAFYPVSSDIHSGEYVRFAFLSQQLLLALWFSTALGLVWAFSSSRSTVAMAMQTIIPVVAAIVLQGTGYLALFRKRRLLDQLGLGAVRRAGLLPSLACIRRAVSEIAAADGALVVPQRALSNWTTTTLLDFIGGPTSGSAINPRRTGLGVNSTTMNMTGNPGSYWLESHGDDILDEPAFVLQPANLQPDTLEIVYEELRFVSIIVVLVAIILYLGQCMFCAAPGPAPRKGEKIDAAFCQLHEFACCKSVQLALLDMEDRGCCHTEDDHAIK